MVCRHYLFGFEHGKQGLSYGDAYDRYDEDVMGKGAAGVKGCQCYENGYSDGKHSIIASIKEAAINHDKYCRCNMTGVAIIKQST